jgi:hypothetical protein
MARVLVTIEALRTPGALSTQDVIDPFANWPVATQYGAAGELIRLALEGREASLEISDLLDCPAQPTVHDVFVDGHGQERLLITRLIDEEEHAPAR